MAEPLFPAWAWAIVAFVALIGLVALGLYLLTRIVAGRVERGFPPEGRFVEVNGHRLHYVDSADADATDHDKPAVLLVHGLGGQLRNFTHSLDATLRDRFRVVALDRAGAGRSERAPGSDHALPAQAADIAAFMDAVGLDRPVVVGHSLGGAIALALGLDHPGKVRGLVLVSPLTAPVDEPPDLFKPLMIESDWRRRATSWTVAVPYAMRYGEEGLAAVFHPEQPPPDFGVRGGGLLGQRPAMFQTTSRDLVALREALPVQHARYDELTVPIAVICGTEDAITPFEEQSAAFAQRTGAELRAVEGAGHMLPVSRAREVADFVAEQVEKWIPAAQTQESV